MNSFSSRSRATVSWIRSAASELDISAACRCDRPSRSPHFTLRTGSRVGRSCWSTALDPAHDRCAEEFGASRRDRREAEAAAAHFESCSAGFPLPPRLALRWPALHASAFRFVFRDAPGTPESAELPPHRAAILLAADMLSDLAPPIWKARPRSIAPPCRLLPLADMGRSRRWCPARRRCPRSVAVWRDPGRLDDLRRSRPWSSRPGERILARGRPRIPGRHGSRPRRRHIRPRAISTHRLRLSCPRHRAQP